MRHLSLFLIACGLWGQLVASEAEPGIHHRQLLGFTADEGWIPGDTTRAPIDRVSRLVSLVPSRDEFISSLDLPQPPVVRRPRAFSIRAELLAGDGVGLAICLRDELGQEFGLRNTPVKTGVNTVTWRIPEDISGRWGTPGDGQPTGRIEVTRVLILRWPHAEPAQLRLDGLDVTESVITADRVRVDLQPQDPIAAVAPGGDAAFVLTSEHDQPITLTWTLSGFAVDGSPLAADPQQLRLAAGERLRLPLPSGLTQSQGVARLRWTLADASGERSGERRLAVVRLAGPATAHREHFMFGCGGWGDTPAIGRIMQQMGIDVLRCSDHWTYQSKAPGVYDWSSARQEARTAAELGFEISWLTAYTPTWALTPDAKPSWSGWTNAGAPRPDAWREYCRQMVENLKPWVNYYEIWNEVDWGYFWSGTTDQYLEMLRIAHEEIKRVDPAFKVLSSGMAGDVGNYELQRRVASEGRDYFDYYAWHQHGQFQQHFQPSVDGRVREFTALAGKPVFYTETSTMGHDTWASQQQQAEELTKKVTYAWARGARAYQWFTPRDGNHTGEPWGFLTHDVQPKPAYAAYATLISVLRPFAPQRLLDLGENRYALVFADPKGTDARQVVVHWREDDRLADADFRIEVGTGASAQSLDLYGNATAEKIVGGQVRLQPRRSPAYLVVNGAPPITAALPLVVPLPAGGIAPGTRSQLALQLGNPADAARSAVLDLRLPKVLGLPAAQRRVALAGGAQSEERVDIAVPEGAQLPYGLLESTLTYDLPGAWSGELGVPLESVRVIPTTPFTERFADFVLGEADVINRFSHDTIARARHWHGKDDLSAELWLGIRDEALVVRALVRDNVHYQPHQGGGETWRADSLQITFAVPGRPGNWEAGIYQRDGQGRAHIYQGVEGLPNPWQQIRVSTTRRADGITYDVAFPLSDFGLTKEILAEGIRFNLVVNDSDGDGDGDRERHQYLRIAEGIAEAKTMLRSPLLRFRLPKTNAQR